MPTQSKLASRVLGFAMVCLCLASVLVDAQERSTAAEGITRITVHTPHWDKYIDKDWSGLYGETFKAVFDPLRIELVLTITAFEPSILQVQRKECDVAMSSYRNQHPGVLYPRWPQELDRAIAIHWKSTAYSNGKDLVGKRVAWLSGYRFDQYLPKGIDFTEVGTEILGLRMLEEGRIDFFIDYEPIILKAAEEGGVDLSKLIFSKVAILAKPVFSIFRDDKRGRQIMAIYDRRMAELYADGTLDRLFRKYGYDGYPAPEH